MEKANKPQANIYIDGANMFYAQQKMGWFIDWKKIREYFNNDFEINDVYYYTGIKSYDKKSTIFNNKLQKYGFKIISKPLKKIHLDKKKFIYKANFDVEIAVDLVRDAKEYNSAILLSGDSDFEYVIKTIKKMGKTVIVCSSKSAMSNELIKVANKIVSLGKIRELIEFK